MRSQVTMTKTGFTLVELVIVIVMISLLSTYAIMKTATPAEITLPSQAQKMASDIRHAQVLAISWGKSLRLSITEGANGTYSLSCVSAGSSPCDVSPVIDPAKGSGFKVSLQKNVVLNGTQFLDFNSLGQPSAAASYNLTSGNTSVAVIVASLTGFVTVSP